MNSIKDVTAKYCPQHFRNIFDCIKININSKFQDDLARYRAISGFIFLRFFCPALISPKNYDLLDKQPNADFARDLTLIAKTLQNIANFSEFSSLKEPYMTPINEFITSHFDSMKSFLDEICTPLEKPVDSSHPTYELNFGREMSRVHYHIQTLLQPMKEKFGENESYLNLTNQILKINEESQRLTKEDDLHSSNNHPIYLIDLPDDNNLPPLKISQTNNQTLPTNNNNQRTPQSNINIIDKSKQ